MGRGGFVNTRDFGKKEELESKIQLFMLERKSLDIQGNTERPTRKLDQC